MKLSFASMASMAMPPSVYVYISRLRIIFLVVLRDPANKVDIKNPISKRRLKPLDDEIGFYILLSGSLRTTQKMIMSREIYTYTLGVIAMDTKLNFIDCPAIGKTPIIGGRKTPVR